MIRIMTAAAAMLLLALTGCSAETQADPAGTATGERAEAIDTLERAADEAAAIVERDALAEAPPDPTAMPSADPTGE
jgi:outer membrane murein-binding lipoprotein Lpp